MKKTQLTVIWKFALTLCGRPSLTRSACRARDGRTHDAEYLRSGLGPKNQSQFYTIHNTFRPTMDAWQLARSSHGLSKVSLRLTKPDPSTPCGRATPETALRLFQGRPSSTPMDTPRRTPTFTPHFDPPCVGVEDVVFDEMPQRPSVEPHGPLPVLGVSSMIRGG
jgi:hypothetical protein